MSVFLFVSSHVFFCVCNCVFMCKCAFVCFCIKLCVSRLSSRQVQTFSICVFLFVLWCWHFLWDLKIWFLHHNGNGGEFVLNMFEVEKSVGATSEWEWEGRESSGIKRDATRNPWLRRDVRSLWTFWGKLELMRWGTNQEMIWDTNRSSWPAIHFDFFQAFPWQYSIAGNFCPWSGQKGDYLSQGKSFQRSRMSGWFLQNTNVDGDGERLLLIPQCMRMSG